MKTTATSHIKRRKFLDQLSKQFNISKPSDWGKITTKQIEDAGGKSLIKPFNSSLFACLQTIYSEIEWKRDWFNKNKFYWTNIEHQKNFLKRIEQKYQIKSFKDWGKITQDIIIAEGGKSILQQNSLQKLLQFHFPQVDWNPEWWPSLPRKYWEIQSNRRDFLDKIKSKFQIKEPKDWGNLTARDIYDSGGYTLLDKYFNNSLFQCLQSVYPEIEWKKEWFIFAQQRNWKTIFERKKFLEEVKVQLNIQTPSDWGKVTYFEIRRFGGKTLLSEYYNGSLFSCLKSIYPGSQRKLVSNYLEVNWNREWFQNLPKFPKTYWNAIDNCREFLSSIASKYNIKTAQDWTRITNSLIRSHGGSGLLKQFNESLFVALQSNFPEKWQSKELFSFPKYTSIYWESPENQKRFLDEIAAEYSILNPQDWKRATPSLIRKHGGYGLLAKHNGSLFQALQSVYSAIDWSKYFKETAHYTKETMSRAHFQLLNKM